jgi:hypothetical protein
MFMLAKFLNHLIKRTTMEMCFFKRLCVIFDDFKCVVVLCLKLSNHFPSPYKGIDQNSLLPSSVFTELYTDRQSIPSVLGNTEVKMVKGDIPITVHPSKDIRFKKTCPGGSPQTEGLVSLSYQSKHLGYHLYSHVWMFC